MALAESLKVLMKEWSRWLLEKDADHDPAADTGANVILGENQGKNIWFIPGTWGRTDIGRRKLQVPVGKKLFIVVGSSHATKDELPIGQQSTPQNLKNYAVALDENWSSTVLLKGPTENGPWTNLQLTTVPTDMFKVNIPRDNGYAKVPGIHGNGIDMVTVGRVHLFTPPSGKTHLIVGALSPATNIGRRGEGRYSVNVEYEITVP